MSPEEVNPDALKGKVIVFDAVAFAEWVSENEEWGVQFLKADGSVVSMHYGTETFLICGDITYAGAPALPPKHTAEELEAEKRKQYMDMNLAKQFKIATNVLKRFRKEDEHLEL